MKKSIFLWLILAAILIFVALKIIKNTRHEQSATPVRAAPEIPADVFIARDTIAVFHLEEIGTVRAYESVEIVSEISKRLLKVNFTEGQMVEKGSLLFKLDDADLRAQLGKLLIQEDLAKKNERRKFVLLEAGGVTQKEYDEELNILETIQADIACLKVELDRTEIRAPFRGRIGIREVSPGAMLSPDIVLATLVEIDRVRIEFSVPERYADNIRVGQNITFSISGLPGVYDAAIEAIQSVINTSTRNLRVMAMARNDGYLFIPGMSAKVFMDFPEMHSSIFIPAQCLIPTNMGYQVYLLKGLKANLTGITAGLRTDVSVQVLEGIVAGDTVVMTNLLRIRNGSAVEIAKVN